MADYKTVGDGQDEVLIAFLPGEDEPRPLHSSHPNYNEVLETLRRGDDPDPDLFSIARAIERRFATLSDRVTMRGSTLYLDNDPVNGALADTVLRFLNEGVEDWKPLIAYFEKVQANPSDNSREQLFTFLQANSGDFAIDPEGYILAYKGVSEGDEDGVYLSSKAGYAIVNGVESNGRVAQKVGDVVEMPRSAVTDDPHVHCSVGLHVSTHSFAQTWASGATLLVRVHPADVVSVPWDSSQKVRVCRYRVVGVVDKPTTEALYDWASTAEFAQDEAQEPVEPDYEPAEQDPRKPGESVFWTQREYARLDQDDPCDLYPREQYEDADHMWEDYEDEEGRRWAVLAFRQPTVEDYVIPGGSGFGGVPAAVNRGATPFKPMSGDYFARSTARRYIVSRVEA